MMTREEVITTLRKAILRGEFIEVKASNRATYVFGRPAGFFITENGEVATVHITFPNGDGVSIHVSSLESITLGGSMDFPL